MIVKNLLVDEYRSLGRRDKKEFQDELIEKLYQDTTPSHDVEEILKTLPLETQELVRKYYLEGIGYEELEKDTGLSQMNLRQRLSRALRGLRKSYEE